MEACQMLKYSYKSSGVELDFTSYHSNQALSEEMETADLHRLSAPEDVAEFFHVMSASSV